MACFSGVGFQLISIPLMALLPVLDTQLDNLKKEEL